MSRVSRIRASASWPSRRAGSRLPKPCSQHHVLRVVRPSLDERHRREHQRLPQRALDAAHVLEVEEVPGVGLVHADGPQRGVAEVPHGARAWRSGGQAGSASVR